MFRKAIVRVPCRRIIDGISASGIGRPDYYRALIQHAEYVTALKSAGLDVKVLDKSDNYPDSTFIEDVALCTPVCAVITNPGAESRRGEIAGMRPVLEEYYDNIEEIMMPGTLEAGDVMMVDNHYFIGISSRTNIEGAEQLIHILEKYRMNGSIVHLDKMLHLKSGVSYLENNKMLVCKDFYNKKDFQRFERIMIDDDESYAANSLWVNGKVLVPAGFHITRGQIELAGFETISVDVSEFRKIDGGLSCLSLRF